MCANTVNERKIERNCIQIKANVEHDETVTFYVPSKAKNVSVSRRRRLVLCRHFFDWRKYSSSKSISLAQRVRRPDDVSSYLYLLEMRFTNGIFENSGKTAENSTENGKTYRDNIINLTSKSFYRRNYGSFLPKIQYVDH